MFDLKRSPEYRKIVPIFAIVFLRSDIAIAQTVIQQQPRPLTQPQANSFDPISILGYGALTVTALWGVGSQLIAKAGSAMIMAKEKRVSQELSQDAAINNGYVRQADKSFEALIRLLDTSIGNILQTSRESKEIFYLGHEKTKENTEAIEKLERIILPRLAEIDSNLAKVTKIQLDIMNVLGMNRGS